MIKKKAKQPCQYGVSLVVWRKVKQHNISEVKSNSKQDPALQFYENTEGEVALQNKSEANRELFHSFKGKAILSLTPGTDKVSW